MDELTGGPHARGELTSLLGQRPEIALNLQSVPEAFGLTKEGAKADRHGGRDGATPEDDLIDRSRCDSYRARHGVLGNPHGLEILLKQYLSRRDGWTHGYNV